MADAAAAKQGRGCMGGSAIEALPEEVLLEVLSLVGSLKDLFALAVTCLRWLRRFTDPAFLRGLCHGEEGHRARLHGFFVQKARFGYCARMMESRIKQHTSALAPTFLPAPGSPFGPTDRALTSFVADDDGAFNYAEPLAARRGVLLMELVPRTTELMDDATIRLLGICNPVTGEQHLLPPLKCGLDRTVRGYAIVTAADHLPTSSSSSSSGRFLFSQLLVTTQRDDKKQLHLHTYSAATRSWSAPTICLHRHRFSLVGERSGVVHQGAAHWLCVVDDNNGDDDVDDRLYKLSMEVGTARVSLTKLPGVRSRGKPILSVTADGNLAVASVSFAHVTVWTHQQGGGGSGAPAVWPRTSTFRIPPAVLVPHPNPPLRYMIPITADEQWFDFNRGSMLGLYRSGAVFILDLEKKVMEKVRDCFLPIFGDKVINITAVAYEMDLEFFTLQLDGLCTSHPKK